MEGLKCRQKEIYAAHPARPDSLRLGLDKYGFSYGLRIKEKKISQIVDSFFIFSGAVVLDIGCREGRLLNKLNARYGVKGIGLDISLSQLCENIKNNPFANIYSAADAEVLPFKADSFDFVFSLDVFEHLPNPQKCLAEISRVLKPKGRCLIYAINQSDRYTWHWFLRKVSFSLLGVDRGEFGDHDRDKFLRAEDIASFAHTSGLEVKKIIFFHSFFTLAFDELWSRLLHFLYRIISAPGKEGKTPDRQEEDKLPSGMRICSSLRDFIAPILEWVDRPWANRGYSNGFFVIAQKAGEDAPSNTRRED